MLGLSSRMQDLCGRGGYCGVHLLLLSQILDLYEGFVLALTSLLRCRLLGKWNARLELVISMDTLALPPCLLETVEGVNDMRKIWNYGSARTV